MKINPLGCKFNFKGGDKITISYTLFGIKREHTGILWNEFNNESEDVPIMDDYLKYQPRLYKNIRIKLHLSENSSKIFRVN